MIFGTIPTGEAEGAILAHTQRLPGRTIRKGAVLDAAAIAALLRAGRDEIIAGRLEAGDVTEDEAAAGLAASLAADFLIPSRAVTGRVNLLAGAPGLLTIDAAAIDALNALDESLTIGTLPQASPVSPREIVATIKVIPFAVGAGLLARAEAIARARAPALRLHPFHPLRVGLVLSTLPGLKDSILEGTEEATDARIAALTGTLLAPRSCPHETGAIAAALGALLDEGADLLLIAGASAVVDRRDVGPAAIVAAGGTIEHFGMPVDPGNLICLGRIGAVPALVLPGCARSPKLNGIDLVLRRLFARLPAGPAEIAGMGVGGLIKDTIAGPPLSDTTARPGRRDAVPASRGPVAAIVLAAGASTRMAPRNKLLIEDASGRAMVARVVDNLLGSVARPIVVVTGHARGEIEQSLAGRPVRLVHAPDWDSGLSASLRAGIAGLPPETAAALVCLGDMPLVAANLLDRLIDTYDPDEGRTIVVPLSGGVRGNPILWDRRHFPAMLALTGDRGARALFASHEDAIAEVELGDDAVLRDFDTPASLEGLPA